jgi:hypothetical protein
LISKLATLLNTLSYLKPIQAIYQVRNRLSKVGELSTFELESTKTKTLDYFPNSAIHPFLRVEPNQLRFEFLNLSRTYSTGSIDWNDQSHGKLWNYNLQYLDFLKQEDISLEMKISLVKDLYSWLCSGELPLEPYPVSLRIMNMIRFLESNQIPENELEELRKYLLAEVNYLSQNLEYHLLANHLLENAFAWWMGALYFQKQNWIGKAEKLVKEQLEEQILSDGAHFELTPMYHQIILFRVLEAYCLTPDPYQIKLILKEKAEKMLGWLGKMTFTNGTVPHFNDTTEGVVYSSETLLKLAATIGLNPIPTELKESGYRMFEFNKLKLIADIEGIKPSYQPGHAHADTFSFVMYHGQNPVIVDPGISTYNISSRRNWERSTLAHNTVTIDRKNSSQVWAGFRVGKRANVKLIEDSEYSVIAQHDGFGKEIHQRSFKSTINGFLIIDEILNLKPDSIVEARFYLHPDLHPEIIDLNTVFLKKDLKLAVNASEIQIEPYDYALGYNKLISSNLLKIRFTGNTLETSLISQA